MIEDEYRFVTVATDFRLIATQAASAIDAVRKSFGGGRAGE
jgi:hypothetical protein